MSGMIAFALRNVRCYARDRSSVFFSLMAVLIVIMLYLLFLRNMLIESFVSDITFASSDQVSGLIDAWVLSGILGIVSVTTSAGSLGTMMDDRVTGKARDFAVTPMRDWEIAGGYILSTFAVGMMMGGIALVLSVAYLAATGCPLTAISVLAAVLLLVPSALSGSVIIYALTSLLRSNGAFSGFFTVVSVLIGFLAGIYMPMGTMPDGMCIVGTLVPATQMAALFRQQLCAGAMDSVFGPYDTSEFRVDMGFDLSLGGFGFTPIMSLVYVMAVTMVFAVFAVLMIRRSR